MQVAVGYHLRTKHHPHRFARSLGFLDWANQPDPFRRHEGAELLRLPLPVDAATTGDGPLPLGDAAYDDLYAPGAVAARPRDLAALSEFLFHALAVSAWKSAGGPSWALRVDPSSGNLHPTEGWLLVPATDGLVDEPSLLHYAPREHGLERRAALDDGTWDALVAGLPEGAFLVALSSVPWREAWKYGERAYRYCQHDTGHALGALRLSAAGLGWRLAALPTTDAWLARLLGLDREGFLEEEPEHPDLLAAVWPADTASVDDGPSASGVAPPARWSPDRAAVDAGLDRARWSGTPNRLSAEHHPWDLVEVAGLVCRREDVPGPALDGPTTDDRADGGAPPGDAGASGAAPGPPAAAATLAATAGPLDDASPRAATVVRTRRSAVAMDGRTGLPRAAFHRMLARTVPGLCPVPWDAWPARPAVHLALFVHRVDGLEPGLYALLRDPSAADRLRAAMRGTFPWERPDGTPDDLPLFRLAAGDVRRHAASLSCQQDIAGDGAFSLGMLADFDRTLAARGAPGYRELFWETGLVGQVLYLEARALGVAATGIGCFFDDPVHATFGLTDTAWQSLYHFTVGVAVHDPRITGHPAYPPPPE